MFMYHMALIEFLIHYIYGPNGHLFYVGGDLMMGRGMLPIIMLPDGDLRIALHLVPFLNFDYLGECSHWGNRGRLA